MLFVNREIENMATAMFIIFTIWVGFVLLNKTTAIVRGGLIYLKSFWNLLDVVIIMLSFAVIAVYVVRINEIRQVLHALEQSKHNEFVIYFHLFHMNDALQFIGATLILIATFRIWKLLRFFKMFKILEDTILFALAPFIWLIFYHCLITFGFALLTYVIFGDSLGSFKTVRESLVSLVLIYMANFHAYDSLLIHEKYSGSGITIMSMYMILAKAIYRFYVAAEMIAYFDAGLHHDERVSYSFIDYVVDEVKFLFSVYKSKIKRLKGGTDSKNRVRPRKHDIFYANCVSTTTSAIKTMTFITRIVLRNMLQRTDTQPDEEKSTLTENETRIMLQICHYFLVNRSVFGDSKEVFFKAYVPSSRQESRKRLKLVDHRRMTAAKLIVETILKPSTEPEPDDILVHDYDIVLKNNADLLNEARDSLKQCLLLLNNVRVR